MAVIAHISHYGLTQRADIDTMVCFVGTVGKCKRLAASHGLTWTDAHGVSTIDAAKLERWDVRDETTAIVGCIMDMSHGNGRADHYWIAIERRTWGSH